MKDSDVSLIQLIPTFLSKNECAELIAFSERCGFRKQRFGTAVPAEIRYRAAVDDPSIALELWDLIRPKLRKLEAYFKLELIECSDVHISDYKMTGLNERLRFYKYHQGERFSRHHDISFEKTESERSFLSVNIYLNDDFEGGETRFDKTLARPQRGSAIVFPHDLWHEGLMVSEGVKRVLRTDVLGLRR